MSFSNAPVPQNPVPQQAPNPPQFANVNAQAYSPQQATHASVISGLSGNEMYCVDALGYRPGNIVIGNSIYNQGFVGSFINGFNNLFGGEMAPVTQMIYEGRHLAMNRLFGELQHHGAVGATGVELKLVEHVGNIEFYAEGSALHRKDGQQANFIFTTAEDGQELYCQIDNGYNPIGAVMGNIAYSLSAGQNLLGGLRTFAKGEVIEYSQTLQHTRNQALLRLEQEAHQFGANSVVGVRTHIMPLGYAHALDMSMIGTASRHEFADPHLNSMITSSNLNAEEAWNLAKIGYAPLKIVSGTSVYSLGVVGSIAQIFKNYVRGENVEMTNMIYAARENSFAQLIAQAQAIGADDVLGVETHVYPLSQGLIEFFVIGTAVKRTDVAKPRSEQLPPQALTRDRQTFFNSYGFTMGE